MNLRDRVILITGASSGIGKACACYLAERGYKVYGTSRNLLTNEQNISLKSLEMIQMDINNEDSVKNGISYVIEKSKRIDIIVNNAGYGIAGAIEETDIEKAKQQFETNFFGAHQICRIVLPIMRKQGSGHIINISSIGGLVGLPYQGFYSASKFALEGYSEALSMEVKSFGIKVTIIEPGDIQTAFTDKRLKIGKELINSNYKISFERVLKKIEKEEREGYSPVKVAELIERVISNPTPNIRYSVASNEQKLFIFLKKFLPAKLVESLLMKFYEV
jgi:short-subunit dehydrogenase